jgi:hypothetical protein
VSLSREATGTDARFLQEGSRLTVAWSRSHAVACDGAQVVATGSLRVSLPSARCVRNATVINATPDRCPVRVGGNGR